MLSKVILESNIVQAGKLIDNSKKILLTSHISPDGDAIGSTLGFYHMLTKLGKNVTVMVPNRYPAFFKWMPGIEKVVIMEENKAESVKIFKESDLIFCIDYNSLDRVNGMKPLIETSKSKIIVIDHHLNPNIKADVCISHPEISSSSELVFRFLCRWGYYPEITLEAAQCIYTGMMTDTGGFTYNSNDPEIYTIIKLLLEKGVDKDDIYRKVFNTYSENRLRLLGYCLNKMEILNDCNTAIITLTLDEQKQFNYAIGDTEGFVNMPLQIENINKSVFLREDKDKIKLSFRSQGDVPVNVLAEKFGGGGHKNAAGGESYTSLENTIVKLKEILQN
ncbi:MAG: bifunctional oligoribonuclease/PAP phosphatase NrnA [Bacteroidales bacterium]|nr:bifunctional oligoribonuclease/PAP phosphatase NrnA [Bacteroidales bacterium]MDD5975825.1 bifunctional oligoribonuclease/PAP phosphatase NrnA [Bacteroidales bacterium]